MVGVQAGTVHGAAGVDWTDVILQRPLFKRRVETRAASGMLAVLSTEIFSDKEVRLGADI